MYSNKKLYTFFLLLIKYTLSFNLINLVKIFLSILQLIKFMLYLYRVRGDDLCEETYYH